MRFYYVEDHHPWVWGTNPKNGGIRPPDPLPGLRA